MCRVSSGNVIRRAGLRRAEMTRGPATNGKLPGRPVVMAVFGTRPEAIKMAPVISKLRASPLLTAKICVTAQHRAMLDQILRVFELIPDVDLDVMIPGQSLPELTSRMLDGLTRVFEAERPDMILVQGDTTTAMVASLAAFYARRRVGHVEAGLRTYDTSAPFPEEANRQMIRVLADYHFAPTPLAAEQLAAERVPAERIIVTGNTGIDAVLTVLERTRKDAPSELAQLLPFLNDGRRLVLITGHRRESFGEAFRNICMALRDLACYFPDVDFVYPVHFNPNVRAPVADILAPSSLQNFHLTDPQDYVPFVSLMDRASLIITDSGGIQEEALSIGKPVLVTREVTERPEGLVSGLVRLVGTDRATIVEAATRILEGSGALPAVAENPYGDGRASERIVNFIEHALCRTETIALGRTPRPWRGVPA